MSPGLQAMRMPVTFRPPIAALRAVGWRNREPERPRATTKATTRATVEWAELIGRVAAHGDRAAFERLFEHFAPRIKGLMLRTGISAEAAEEIAQETLLAVWRKADQFNPTTAGAAAWIFTIARNLRIDAARRAARSGSLDHSAELEYFADPSDSQETLVLRQDAATRIEAALQSLSNEQSAAIRMSFIEQRPHSEIASLLGLPLGTVKSRIRLAVTRLKSLLDDGA